MKRVGESEVELTINMESEMRRKRNKVTSKVEMKKMKAISKCVAFVIRLKKSTNYAKLTKCLKNVNANVSVFILIGIHRKFDTVILRSFV